MSCEKIKAEDMAAGERLFASPTTFIKSVPDLQFLPPADRPEIAFAGRSNVGKSSLINALARQKQLARASNTPGRTQELNFFCPALGELYLIDMPGYGFAEAPKDKVEVWTQLVKEYLAGRPTLARVFLLVDARHGLKKIDKEIMRLLDVTAVTYQVVLTKADKISERALGGLIAATEKSLALHTAAFPAVHVTSSETNLGIAELRAIIARITADYTRRGGATRH
jgi:GTP-binding protein